MTETLEISVDLSLVKAPFDRGVNYFQRVNFPLGIRSRTTSRILIEEVGLNFQCEWEAPPDKLCIKVACDGQLIEPGGFVDLTVPIRASLLFQLNTNSFVVHVRYRIDTNRGPGPQRLSRLADTDYVIVRPVPRYEDALVFVSFRTPRMRELRG